MIETGNRFMTDCWHEGPLMAVHGAICPECGDISAESVRKLPFVMCRDCIRDGWTHSATCDARILFDVRPLPVEVVS